MHFSAVAIAVFAMVAGVADCGSRAGDDRSVKRAAPAQAPPSDEPITYSSGGCLGMCPVYSVTVTPTGGTFRGGAFTAATGDHRFALSQEQYRAFAAKLARFRPHGDRLIYDPNPDCGVAHTDDASVEVRWGKTDHLALYFGCENPALQPMKEALGTASDLLPIAALIGKR